MNTQAAYVWRYSLAIYKFIYSYPSPEVCFYILDDNLNEAMALTELDMLLLYFFMPLYLQCVIIRRFVLMEFELLNDHCVGGLITKCYGY